MDGVGVSQVLISAFPMTQYPWRSSHLFNGATKYILVALFGTNRIFIQREKKDDLLAALLHDDVGVFAKGANGMQFSRNFVNLDKALFVKALEHAGIASVVFFDVGTKLEISRFRSQ